MALLYHHNFITSADLVVAFFMNANHFVSILFPFSYNEIMTVTVKAKNGPYCEDP
jgi:hypothetical protein